MRHSTTTAGANGRSRGPGRALLVSGLVLLAVAGAWQGYAWLWARHVQHTGHALVTAHRRSLATSGALASCPPGAGRRSSTGTAAPTSAASTGAATTGTDPVAGVLSVPALGLVAPVEAGVSTATLAVAVGHIPASVWPGATGTSILAAHDVSYFVHIDRLAVGDSVDYRTACTTYHFTVSGHQVVKAGSPLYNSAGPTLVLETCWPTDALWYTPDRLLVTATEVGVQRRSTAASHTLHDAALAGARPPAVPAPPALVAQGLTLATNDIPMGTLTETTGVPTAWSQSPAPLAVESSALQAFIGGLKAVEQGNGRWWQDLAPGVAMPAGLQGGSVTDWHQGLDVAISLHGTTPVGVTLSATVSISGPVPGLFTLTADETIASGTLTLHSWTLSPTAA